MASEKKYTGSIQKQLYQPGSALAKYRLSVMGDKGFLELVFFELVVIFCGSFSGKTGCWLRSLFLRFFFGSLAGSVKIGVNCTFRLAGRIKLAERVIIGDDVILGVKINGIGISIRQQVEIGSRVIFNCSGGEIIIGSGTRIGPNCRLGSLLGLSLGRNCRLGRSVCISGASHSFQETDRPIIEQPLTAKGHTIIGDNVHIGDNATILDGVRIGNNVRIAADSLVNKDILDNCRVSGVPAVPEKGR